MMKLTMDPVSNLNQRHETQSTISSGLVIHINIIYRLISDTNILLDLQYW